jgi:hypothetical protein
MNTGTQTAKEAGNMVDLDSNPTKLIEIVEIGKQLLMTRGALTTFSIANDVAKYFAINAGQCTRMKKPGRNVGLLVRTGTADDSSAGSRSTTTTKRIAAGQARPEGPPTCGEAFGCGP